MSDTPGPRCPVCRKAALHAHRPFCSKRCADVDLARWLGGRYVIEGSNVALDEDATSVRAAPPADGDDPDDA